MHSKLLLNLTLLAAVVVLALLAFYPPGGGEDEADQPLLTDLKPEQISRIELQREGEPAIVLVREAGRWRMLAPYAVEADATRVGFLLDFLGARSLARFAVAEADLAKYGLDKPHAVLHLNGRRFEFGAQHPLAANRYVRAGDAVHLITDIINQHLMAQATSYVSPRLIEDGAGVASIAVPGLTVEQKDGKLTASPASTSADAVATFVEEWRRARAMRVRPLTPAESDRDRPDSAEVHLANGRAVTFQIVGREPVLLLARIDLGLAYEVAADVGKRLLASDGGKPAP
ncbi:MAG: DUF4340 domain-containing protein [Chromatiales bacterium]